MFSLTLGIIPAIYRRRNGFHYYFITALKNSLLLLLPRRETVQITPYLIYSGHDSRRDDRIIRSTTQASLRAAYGSHRAIAGSPGTHRRIGAAENACARLRQSGEEKAARGAAEGAQKA